jgi:hypothetical protein
MAQPADQRERDDSTGEGKQRAAVTLGELLQLGGVPGREADDRVVGQRDAVAEPPP